MTVCVIADDDDVLFFVSRVLERAGASVTTTHDGIVGIDTVIEQGTQLVIVDVLLPDMQGLEVGRRLRTYCEHQVHLVALSGLSEPAIEGEVSAAGFDEVLRKPIDSRSLTKLLVRLENQRN